VHPTVVGPDTLIGGRYRLLRQRADRPGSALWRAVDEVLERPVAVRVVPLRDAAAGKALNAAVARASRVADARAVRVLDAGIEEHEDGRIGWVVSEWVEAPTLAAVLRDGPLTPAEAAGVVCEVAQTLVAANLGGAAHGHLTPGDVLLQPDGAVRVADIEIAAAVAGEQPDDPQAGDARALGSLLYAALTGSWPDAAAHGLPAAPRADHRLCTPRQVRAGVPSPLDALTVRALSGGFDSPAALAAALESQPRRAYGVAPEPPAEPGEPSRLRIWAVRALPFLGLVVIGVGGWLLGSALGRVPSTGTRVPSFPTPSASGSGSTALHLLWSKPPTVTSFDPQGDGTEGPDQVGFAVDADPSSAWETDRYRGSGRFGNLKDGVGIVIDLGSSQTVRQAQIALTRPDADLELRVSDTPATDLASYRVVATATQTKQLVVLKPQTPTSGRYWLVWLTRLPPDGGGFREGIAEVGLYG
jgi:hypothetical protein